MHSCFGLLCLFDHAWDPSFSSSHLLLSYLRHPLENTHSLIQLLLCLENNARKWQIISQISLESKPSTVAQTSKNAHIPSSNCTFFDTTCLDAGVCPLFDDNGWSAATHQISKSRGWNLVEKKNRYKRLRLFRQLPLISNLYLEFLRDRSKQRKAKHHITSHNQTMSGSTVISRGIIPSVAVVTTAIAAMLHARSEQRERVFFAHQEAHGRHAHQY